jgi:hypothetical protein
MRYIQRICFASEPSTPKLLFRGLILHGEIRMKDFDNDGRLQVGSLEHRHLHVNTRTVPEPSSSSCCSFLSSTSPFLCRAPVRAVFEFYSFVRPSLQTRMFTPIYSF